MNIILRKLLRLIIILCTFNLSNQKQLKKLTQMKITTFLKDATLEVSKQSDCCGYFYTVFGNNGNSFMGRYEENELTQIRIDFKLSLVDSIKLSKLQLSSLS